MRSPLLLGILTIASLALAAETKSAPYHIVQSARVGGAGGFDYVFADQTGRRLYIPRGNRVTVFALDSLKPVGEIPGAQSVHGVAVDPVSHHGFCSSNPVLMWDTSTLAVLKSIPVQGAPDAIHFDPTTQRIFVLSHRAPNATILEAKDGSIVGTMDLGGAPEQAASDGQGKIYVAIEDKDQVAVIDARALRVVGTYSLGGKGGTPAGLALDAKTHVLFVCCRNPATMVMLNADTGAILTALPIGAGTDGAAFNPATLEAFSSNRDGTLTVVAESSPTTFAVKETVKTMTGAKTCTLDAKTNRVILIAAETAPPVAADGQKSKSGRGQMVPDSFTILAVGR